MTGTNLTQEASKMNSDGLMEVAVCEVCGAEGLESVLDLGCHPLCDDLVPISEDRICAEYPIEILFCKACKTGHQKYQVPKENLFPRNYHYRSRFTADVLTGMQELVESVESKFGNVEGKLVLDVGCNDGSLLDFFRNKGASTVGIEPTGAAEDARALGHRVYHEFLSETVAREIAEKIGRPDYIVFTNVFAHIENLASVIDSLRLLLKPDSTIVIENHFLGAILEGHQFDTFYHEHPRTYSYSSFKAIAKSLELKIATVEFPSRYGGNIRVFLGGSPIEGSSLVDVEQIQAAEERYVEMFEKMAEKLVYWKDAKRSEILQLVEKYGKLRAKAFPGRAAIIMKLLGINEKHIKAVHEKPGSMKINTYVPGTRIPIVSDDILWEKADLENPIVNLAWHIPEEIKKYLRDKGYKGEILDIVTKNDLQ